MAKNYSGYELYHHGILGQKWGVRRFENKDGSLTPEGKERYQKKAQKIKENINSWEQSRKVQEVMAERAQTNADKYREGSKTTPPKNVLYALERKLVQRQLDKTAKDYKELEEIGRKKVNKYIKKVGKDPHLSTTVYLADIWDLPYDYYDIRVHDKRKEK